MASSSRRARNRVLYLAPVGLVAVVGLAWVLAHAESGRGQMHTLFQLLALAESVTALLLRRRKPVGTLASILVVYLLVDLEPITALPVLVALMTVTWVSSRRTVVLAAAATTVVVVTMPYLHGDHPTVAAGLIHASAVLCTVTTGRYLRSRKQNPLPTDPAHREDVPADVQRAADSQSRTTAASRSHQTL